MDRPTIGDAHLRLHRLAGQWGGEETLHPAPHDPGGPATAFVNNRIALDGFTVVQEYEQYRPGQPTYSGHGVFWFDGATSQYALVWFDSMMGMAFDFRGDFEGEVLRLVNALPQGGFLRATFDIGLPGEYVFVMEFSPDGAAWSPTMEGAYGLLNGPTPRERKKRVARRVQAAAVKAPARTGSARTATTTTGSRAGASKKPGTAKQAAARKAQGKTVPARTVAGRKAAKKAARGKK